MPYVLTTASTILCGLAAPKLHGGNVTKNGTPKFTVAGDQVVLEPGLGAIPDCKTVPPPATQKACTKVTMIDPVGKSTKLFVGGVPVLLETLTGMTDGVPPGPLKATANQAKLSAV